MALVWTTHIKGGPQKVNHAAALVGKNIYSFGGFSTLNFSGQGTPIDVYVLCTVTNRWERIPTPTDANELLCVPFQRYGHTAVAHGTNIYIWGGKNEQVACNRLFCFDAVTYKWSCPNVEGPIPRSRDAHTATIVDNKMYIIGGFIEELEQYAQGLYVLDLITMRWSYIYEEGPSQFYRDFHAAAALNGKIYVFGGRSGLVAPYYTNNEVYPNDLYIFDIKTETWTRKVSPRAPPGRRSLGMVAYKNRLYIFGGYDGKDKVYYNDVHYYNTELEEWSGELKTYGIPPCKRRRHCTILVNDKIIIFGGTSPFDDSYKFYADSMENLNLIEYEFLVDLNDTFVLDLKPTLATLCMAAIANHGLNIDCLPKTLQRDIKWMTANNEIVELQ